MNGLRIGLLGGSFNPAHEGHRHISLVALQRLRLDAVWWLVSPQNPLKSKEGMAAFVERLAGAETVARHPRIHVSDIEAKLGTRFTVDTLLALRRRHRRHNFVWIMGADNLIQLPRWRRWTTIFDTVPVAVLARPAYSSRALSGPAAQRFRQWRLPDRAAGLLADRGPPSWVFLHTPLHPASATEIRAQRLIAPGDVPM
jgi:nicotinate-nucleotide adenylyltransferase